MTAVLNAANEAANEMYRADVGLGFLDIPRLIEGAMEGARQESVYRTEGVTLEDILEADGWARQYVAKKTENMVKGQALIV